MIGSTILIAMGYLSAPGREAAFTQTVTGTIVSVEQNGRALRIENMTWGEGAQEGAASMKQLYAQVSSGSTLKDQWGSDVAAEDLPEGVSVRLEIGRFLFRDEAKTVASAKIVNLVLDPQ